MRILFVMRHAGYVRNFEAVLRGLAERGHSIHFGLELERKHDIPEVADRLAADYEQITWGPAPTRTDRWLELTVRIRHAIDYVRYLMPVYGDAWKLRARGEKFTPEWILKLTKRPGFRSPAFIRLLSWFLRTIDRGIPTSAEIDAYIREQRPDLVLVTPLLAGPSQEDFVQSAKALGIPTALPVHSWDNLTNKGLIREIPNRIYVWNEAQRDEAVKLHGLKADQVAVVGAHSYDHWFHWQPSTTREEFCERVGIDPEQPFVLYLCSSGFIAVDERPIVRSWLETLRGRSEPHLKDIGAIVRPHPSTGRMWSETPTDEFENALVFPPIGADPRNKSNRDEYYDSFSHCAAVVGINTSALIEAAIAGRRSYGFRVPELYGGQEGTLHFHYLRDENGGPLTLADSLDEHFDQLAAAIEKGQPADWNRRFLESFIRPQGLEVDCAPLFVSDLEDLAESAPRRAPMQLGRKVVSLLLYPVARWVHWRDSGHLRRKMLRGRFGVTVAKARVPAKPKPRADRPKGKPAHVVADHARRKKEKEAMRAERRDRGRRTAGAKQVKARRGSARKRLRRAAYATAQHVLPTRVRAALRSKHEAPEAEPEVTPLPPVETPPERETASSKL